MDVVAGAVTKIGGDVAEVEVEVEEVSESSIERFLELFAMRSNAS